jgi:DNA-binding NtrC family response regulator
MLRRIEMEADATRVVIAIDDDDLRDALRQFLTTVGDFDVWAFGHAAAALAITSSARVDATIIDLSLRGDVRAVIAAARGPILVSTEPRAVALARALGAEFMALPPDGARLLSLVNAIASRRRAPGAAPASGPSTAGTHDGTRSSPQSPRDLRPR